jgi:nucleotide-binding universal stress UspA family protein
MNPRILVPFDFSAAAEAALAWAVELHRSCGGAIKLIHVLSFPPVLVGVGAGEPLLPGPTEDDIKKVELDLRQVADRLVLKAEIEVLLGTNIGDTVLRAAGDWSPDLIAMGTHGRGGVKRLLLGSVADIIVRSASCPVLTVRSPTPASAPS